MARALNTDVKSYDSRKIYSYVKNGRKTSTKDVKRTAIYWNDEIGSHHYESVDVNFNDVPEQHPIMQGFRIALCVILTSLFVFGSFNIERGVYFGEYENYNNFSASNYMLDNGKTIQQVYTDNNIIDDVNLVSNDYDWFNKFDTLSRLKPIITYSNLYNSGAYKYTNEKPTNDKFLDFTNLFRDSTQKNAFYDLYNKLNSNNGVYCVWSVAQGFWLYSYNSEYVDIKLSNGTDDYILKTINNTIIKGLDDRKDVLNVMYSVLVLPFTMFSNIIYDVVVLVDFVKNW